MMESADALAGCLLGQALGDALGFVVESEPPAVAAAYVESCLLAAHAGTRSRPGYEVGQYTDDTQLAREILRSIRKANGWDPECFARYLADLFHDRRAVGAGPGSTGAARRLMDGTGWREAGQPAPYAGNGSAMRAAPLGVFFRADVRGMIAAAREQSRVTHQDPRCAAGAIAIAGAAAIASESEPIRPIAFLERVAEWAGVEDRSVAEAILGVEDWLDLGPPEAARRLHAGGLDPGFADSWRGISSFVTPSVAWSLYSFLRSPDDYWTTICTAIGVGGDTDTLAAMAGGISGARLGPQALPAALIAGLHDRGTWRADDLVALARDCALLVPVVADSA
jgi:ADP-ribosylglycohydrolase